jgi:protoporphyrinogen oxidase
MKIAILGAGVAGLTAAYELTTCACATPSAALTRRCAHPPLRFGCRSGTGRVPAGAGKSGHTVTIYEADSVPGGLTSGFKAEGWDWYLERFYHHWFQSDYEVINLIKEIGQGDKLFFPRPITAIWHKGAAYPFDSPLAALRFPHLSWIGKFRFGLVGLYLRLTRNWQPLERYTADTWLPRYMGREAYEILWKPLLVGKFGDYYTEVNMAWFWARLHKRSPRLGYFVGGFQAFVDALAERIRAQGGTIHLNTPVEQIAPRNDGGLTLHVAGSEEAFDAVISTLSPRLMSRLTPALPQSYLDRLQGLESLGAVALILALERQLTDGFYWINLPKSEGFPFLALVEHTNYISPEHYGGDHLIYCGDYLPSTHEYFKLTQEELLARFLPALSHFNPAFTPSWVRRSWLFRTLYAQPMVPVNYSQYIPDIRTPIPGLYFASMSQVYPWDRGTNYAVEIGRKAARLAAGV